MANTAEAWQAGAIDGHDDEPRTAVAAAELLLDASSQRHVDCRSSVVAAAPQLRAGGPAAAVGGPPVSLLPRGWCGDTLVQLLRFLFEAQLYHLTLIPNTTCLTLPKQTEKKVKTSRAISRN